MEKNSRIVCMWNYMAVPHRWWEPLNNFLHNVSCVSVSGTQHQQIYKLTKADLGSSRSLRALLTPNSKVHEAYIGRTCDRQGPGGPHVGHMNLAIRDFISCLIIHNRKQHSGIKTEAMVHKKHSALWKFSTIEHQYIVDNNNAELHKS